MRSHVHTYGEDGYSLAPLSEAELDECRTITQHTPIDSVSIGPPDVVVARLVATIDDLKEKLARGQSED